MEKPPPSGLGRSIDELFQQLSAPTTPGAPGEAALGNEAEEPARTEAPPPDQAATDPSPANDAGDRLVGLVSGYLDGAPDERDGLAPQILEVAAEVRAAGDPGAVLDAVVALSVAGAGGDDEEALALGRELLDAEAATALAARIGRERDEEARDGLAQTVACHPDIVIPPLVEALAESADRGARRSLMEVLRALGERGREAALGLLEDDRWFAVRNGVVLIGELGGDDAVQALTAPLGHDDPRVRREAVTALSKVGGENAGLLLLGMLEDGAPEVRAAAATGVGLLGVQKAVRPLEEMLDREDSEDVVVPVLRALGQLGDPGPVPAIEKRAVGSLFSRPPRDVRVAAYRALGAIGTPHARSVLRNGAGDKDPEVRHAVGMLLRQLAQERQDGGEAPGESGPETGDQ